MPHALPTLREIIQHFGLAPKKSLGQNFLTDPQLLRRIAQSAGSLNNANVLEIGPGPGGLTRAILELGAQSLTVIERDDRCIAALDLLNQAYPHRLSIVSDDALQIKPQDIMTESFKIIANLPYNIGTILLLNWFQDLERIESITVLLQKEVVLRLNAKPKTKDYGRLSVITQWLCQVNRQFDIGPSAFYPPPKVVSTVVTLVPKNLSPQEKELTPLIEKITQAAFAQRRKMLRTTVKNILSEEDLLACQIQPTQRAEELSVQDYANLATRLKHRQNP